MPASQESESQKCVKRVHQEGTLHTDIYSPFARNPLLFQIYYVISVVLNLDSSILYN